MIHDPAAMTTSSAASGRDACRSTLDSKWLTTDLDRPREGPGLVMESAIARRLVLAVLAAL